MSHDRLFGGGPTLGCQVRVHPVDDCRHGIRAGRNRSNDLPLAHGPVGAVLLDEHRRRGNDFAVRRQDDERLERSDAIERGEVLPQVAASAAGNHDRAAFDEQVAAEQRP